KPELDFEEEITQDSSVYMDEDWIPDPMDLPEPKFSQDQDFEDSSGDDLTHEILGNASIFNVARTTAMGILRPNDPRFNQLWALHNPKGADSSVAQAWKQT